MVARKSSLALGALALGYAVLVWANGADRLSAGAIGWQRLVPGPFRAGADVALAEAAIARRDLPLAQNAAARAIAASPMDRRAVGLFALSRLARGDESGADDAFRVSGRLGWRDVPTQLYWYQVGLDSADYTLAAQRADAVLRANPRYAQADLLLAPLESNSKGQDALLARLLERPGWLATYAQPLTNPQRETLARRAAMLGRLAHSGIALGCAAVNGLSQQLVDNGQRALARQVWSDHCSKSPATGILFDPRFRSLSTDRRSPFDWSIASSGDVDVKTAGTAGAELLNASPFDVPVLAQTVDLAPGRYVAQLDVASPATAGRRLYASLTCGTSPRRSGNAAPGLTGAGQMLEAPTCPVQTFALWLRPGSEPVMIRQVTLEPAR